MTRNKLLIFIVPLLSILLFHINNGLTTLIVFPAIIITLLLTISILVNLNSNYMKYFLIIIVSAVIALLSYSLVPYSVGDRYPDVNNILQLVELFSTEKRVILGAGTNEAFYYSFYPLFEILLVTLSYYSNINTIYILRIYPIFAIFCNFIIWVSIYKFINRQIYSEAMLLSLLSFHFSTFLIRPLHPGYAFMLFSLLLLLFVIGMSRGYKPQFLVTSILTITAIVIAHNTTSIIFILILILFYLVYFVLYKFLKFTSFINPLIMRKVFLIFSMTSITLLLYNIYISTYFFRAGILYNFIYYLSFILRSDILPFDVILGFRKSIHINLFAPSFLGWIIDRVRSYLGYIGLVLYLVVFLSVSIHILFYKRSFNFNSTSSLFFMLSLSTILLLLFTTFTWPAFYSWDYYWRFYSYFFFFSSPFVIWYIFKLRKRIATVLFFVILLNVFLWKPPLAFGIDTPFELADPRIGIKESVVLASYLAERYDGRVIVGTRYVFETIGPLSGKTAITIYSDKDLEKPYIKTIKTYLFIFSSTEIKMLPISINVNERDLLYKSGEFFIYK